MRSYLDIFINTSSNHMTSSSCLVSQPNSEVNSHNKRKCNSTGLSHVKFQLQNNAVKFQ